MQLTPAKAKELLLSPLWTDLCLRADAIAFDEWKQANTKGEQQGIRYSLDHDGYLKKALMSLSNEAPIVRLGDAQ